MKRDVCPSKQFNTAKCVFEVLISKVPKKNPAIKITTPVRSRHGSMKRAPIRVPKHTF